jgi:hypothetical protein
MRTLIEKAVWLADMERVHNVIKVLGQLYRQEWQGGLLFRDSIQGGFLLVVTLHPDHYAASGTPWETIFPSEHLRSVTLEEACFNSRRYHAWLSGDIPDVLRLLKLLPSPNGSEREDVPSLAAVRAERDPPGGLP